MNNKTSYLNHTQVQAAFNKAAATYNNVAHVQELIAERLLERLSCFKIAPETILDAGCGTGFLLHKIAQHYPEAQVFGLDFALNMLKQTKMDKLICARLEELPLKSHSMDLIVCTSVLQWCPDLKTVFNEFARLLKPEGILLFSSFGPDTLYELRQSWAAVDIEPHVNIFLDLHELGDALLASGLVDPVMDMQRIKVTYKNSKRLFLDLKQLGASNRLANRAEGLTGKTRFKAMTDAYEAFRDDKGLLPATYEVIYGYALGAEPASTTDLKPQKIRFIKNTNEAY